MAFAAVFPCQNIPYRCRFNLTALTNVRSPIYRRNLQIPRGKEVVPEPIFGTRNAGKYVISHRWRPQITPPAVAANSESSFEILSLSDVVKKFYRCINEGDRKGLEDLISSNCRLEDSTFPYIIQGKKEVMSLFIQLAESMGETVHFKLGTICEGDELTASVNWHLEWKNDQIPFSRGCSVFQCSNEDGRLVIMNAQIITESPIKPAKLAMTLLKTVTSLINEFPDAAKCKQILLTSIMCKPYVILHKHHTYICDTFRVPKESTHHTQSSVEYIQSMLSSGGEPSSNILHHPMENCCSNTWIRDKLSAHHCKIFQ
ncbi:hypothetical protein BVRB_5g100050 [Beta vulgaris subsp. vulgaris]|uniref:uncharacterized protein LOC104892254 isoform X1 n=1 Tax=Beta vulgaris subsp. vulgaris TaxID=3555 RepID=UPI00054008B2|nr:uncharacterized protein LOC104892254 isoform X1 [Beta vulgaris subsp. vulgaris]KMT12046.1 hypothetical protein BVRB_5g100050 [Beta vulgaris subsp. vulgaris]